MRFKTFTRKKVDGDRAELLPFQPEHYRKAGVPSRHSVACQFWRLTKL